MKTTRRKFFGFMAAAPVAAQSTAEQFVGLGPGGVLGGSVPSALGPADDIQACKTLSDFFKAFGFLPPWKIQQERERTKYVNRLDADIAGLRSVSMSAKLSIQSDRDFEKSIHEVKYGTWYDELKRWRAQNPDYRRF